MSSTSVAAPPSSTFKPSPDSNERRNLYLFVPLTWLDELEDEPVAGAAPLLGGRRSDVPVTGVERVAEEARLLHQAEARPGDLVPHDLLLDAVERTGVVDAAAHPGAGVA